MRQWEMWLLQPDQAGEGEEKRSTMWYGRWVNPWLRPFNTKHVITVAREGEGGAFQGAKWFPLLYPHNGKGWPQLDLIFNAQTTVSGRNTNTEINIRAGSMLGKDKPQAVVYDFLPPTTAVSS